MKTKSILLALTLVTALALYSFKSAAEKETSNTALVCPVFGKGDNEGFMISYGDGSTEVKQFNFKMKLENYHQQISKMAVIMNEMHVKGYHYVGEASHLPYESDPKELKYLVFEKK